MSSEEVGSNKPQLDLGGLASEWDNDPAVRCHMREDETVMFPEGTTESVRTACQAHVAGFLTPLLVRMASTEGNPRPLIEPLREQLTLLYQSASKQKDENQIKADSWSTRKFLGFVKMKARLEKPSKVT